MKKTYIVSKKIILFMFLCLLGLFLIFKYGTELWKYSHPKELENCFISELRKGEYVECDISSYLVIPVDEHHPDTYTGQSEIYSTLTKEYVTYTIPDNSNKYIRIMVYEDELIEKLESYTKGEGAGISFVGKVVNGTGINTKWYKKVSGFHINSLYDEICIQQISSKGIKNYFIIGVMCFLVSLVGFLKGDCIEINVEPLYTEQPGKKYSYNTKDEILLEKARLEIIKKEEKSLKIWALAGCLILFIGGYIFVKNDWLEIKIPGVLISLFGMQQIWRWFINSENGIAVKLADIFGINTICKRKRQTEDKIGETAGE